VVLHVYEEVFFLFPRKDNLRLLSRTYCVCVCVRACVCALTQLFGRPSPLRYTNRSILSDRERHEEIKLAGAAEMSFLSRVHFLSVFRPRCRVVLSPPPGECLWSAVYRRRVKQRFFGTISVKLVSPDAKQNQNMCFLCLFLCSFSHVPDDRQ